MGTPESPDATDPPQKWLLEFTSSNPNASDGDGRPWGDGTAMAARASAGQAPWDLRCGVHPMIGGYQTLNAIRDAIEAAIEDAEDLEKQKVPPGKRGHVYITDWQFNALRDLSSGSAWGNKPWNPSEKVTKDQTALGLVLRMMSAGIAVRMLLWMPDTEEWVGMKHIENEHWSVAAAVQDHEKKLQEEWKGKWTVEGPIGVVALDMRIADQMTASLHQKMVVVRSRRMSTAFCGGVDFAFTRRDYALAPDQPVGEGDWQSGTKIPLDKNGWPRQSPPPLGGYPAFPYVEPGKFPTDLPEDVYGSEYQNWHDHHLQLTGPIVSTIESQFGERWVMNTGGRVELFDRTQWFAGTEDRVKLTSGACIKKESTGEKVVVPLPAPEPIQPRITGPTVQMWRTIPLRNGVKRPPFLRGEFTVMAGVAKAMSQATQLITIFDQYFWSVPLAKLLAWRLNAVPGLRLLIVLPPFGCSSEAKYEHGLRRRALKALWDGLQPSNRARVTVLDLWSLAREKENGGRGVYVHAKSQVYDDQLLVVGSANMNRRSMECDAELDCAVLDQGTASKHLATLYGHLTGKPWADFGAEWLKRFWEELTKNRPPSLIKDHFFVEKVDKPKTPNHVEMPCEEPGFLEWIFEPTSIGAPVEKSTCQFPQCPGDPKVAGRLDEVTYLLERCHDGSNWPWRKPASLLEAADEKRPEPPRLLF